MDAAYDSVGEARPDSPRATIAKKPRNARKPRSDKDAVDAPRTPRTDETAPLPPQPEPASAAATPAAQNAEPVPAEAGNTDSEKPGAKVVSLDAFRKK
jgi:hypothetical protein